MTGIELRARRAVTEALSELLDELGVEHGGITDRLRPIGDLALESIDGIDFACRLSGKLGLEVPNQINPFVDDATVRARTVKQIVDLVAKLLYDTEVSSRG